MKGGGENMEWLVKPRNEGKGPCPKSACWTLGQCTYRECKKAACIAYGKPCPPKSCIFYGY